ncbi:unnamed protein product [Fraxinus pennsylvanica]|uniref:Uncharacterized protein n=1 Tax=Fraxinus pennsylvanica TaxID=56036 RepID=A0AAD1ZDW6_9LAMI|nr:unnamed protein product [Fraxinus pennsylvanica]
MDWECQKTLMVESDSATDRRNLRMLSKPVTRRNENSEREGYLPVKSLLVERFKQRFGKYLLKWPESMYFPAISFAIEQKKLLDKNSEKRGKKYCITCGSQFDAEEIGLCCKEVYKSDIDSAHFHTVSTIQHKGLNRYQYHTMSTSHNHVIGRGIIYFKDKISNSSSNVEKLPSIGIFGFHVL